MLAYTRKIYEYTRSMQTHARKMYVYVQEDVYIYKRHVQEIKCKMKMSHDTEHKMQNTE